VNYALAVADESKTADATAATAMGDASSTRIADAFERIDANRDGVLSRAEVIRACRRDPHIRFLLGLPAAIRQEDGTRDAFERVFQGLDADGSKSIDLQEFARAFSPLCYAPSADSCGAASFSTSAPELRMERSMEASPARDGVPPHQSPQCTISRPSDRSDSLVAQPLTMLASASGTMGLDTGGSINFPAPLTPAADDLVDDLEGKRRGATATSSVSAPWQQDAPTGFEDEERSSGGFDFVVQAYHAPSLPPLDPADATELTAAADARPVEEESFYSVEAVAAVAALVAAPTVALPAQPLPQHTHPTLRRQGSEEYWDSFYGDDFEPGEDAYDDEFEPDSEGAAPPASDGTTTTAPTTWL
jgi:hypothetical protein